MNRRSWKMKWVKNEARPPLVKINSDSAYIRVGHRSVSNRRTSTSGHLTTPRLTANRRIKASRLWIRPIVVPRDREPIIRRESEKDHSRP